MKRQTIAAIAAAGTCVAGIIGVAQARGVPSAQSESQRSPEIMASLLQGPGVSEAQQGLYIMPVAEGQDRELVFKGPVANNGAVIIDNVYYCNKSWSWGGLFTFYEIYGYDMQTGSEVFKYEEDDATAYFAQGGMSLDPMSGCAMGVFYDSEMKSVALGLVSYQSSRPVKTILAAIAQDAPVCNAFAVDGAGNCYAVGNDGVLYGISRETGAFTTIGETGYVPSVMGSAAIDDASGMMYWYMMDGDGVGRLVKVDLSTGSGTTVMQYGETRYGGLCIARAESLPGAPAACSDVNVSFTAGQLTGNVTLITPSVLYDGSAGSGDLTVYVYVSGRKVAEKSAGWGASIEIPVDMTEMGQGCYDFTVYAVNSVGSGPRTNIRSVWVGADTPASTVAALTQGNGKFTVSWEPVTTSVNGGFIDVDNITYTVTDMSGAVVGEGLKGTSLDVSPELPDNGKPASVWYAVVACASGLESAPARTNTIIVGHNEVPYETDFAEDNLHGFTVLDSNKDGISWVVEDGVAVIQYSETAAMDDWLIAPPVALQGGNAYPVKATIYAESMYIPERIEMKYGRGNTVEAMTKQLMEPTEVAVEVATPMVYEGYMMPDESGDWFLGFHGISDIDQFKLYVSQISIGLPISALVPAKVSNLTVEPNRQGACEATVSFETPAEALNGTPVETLTRVEVRRGETLVKTFENPAVGASLSFTDVLESHGTVEYTVTAFNAHGAGLPATASAYVGFNPPAASGYVNIARTEEEGFVKVSWDAVTADEDGTLFPEGLIVYDIYIVGQEEPAVAGVTTLEQEFRAVAEGEQQMIQCEVKARFEELSGAGAMSARIPVGTPYNGLNESGMFGNYVWGISDAGGAQWGVVRDGDIEGFPDSADGDGYYFACVGSEINDMGVLFTGLVSLVGIENPGVTFRTYNFVGSEGSPDLNEITVSVKPEGSDQWVDLTTKIVNDVCHGQDEWGKVIVPLGDFAGEVIQVQFAAVVKTYVGTMIDGVAIGEITASNLAVSGISAPATVACGREFQINVTVDNCGTVKSGDYRIDLYADGVLAGSEECGPIDSGLSYVHSFDMTMSPLASAPVTYYAEVVWSADGSADDNRSKEITVTPRQSVLPVPADLAATNVDRTVSLKWDAPAGSDGTPITDDFEDADSFASEYGDWVFVDIDGAPVGGMQNTDIPNIISGVTKGSFWIWDTDVLPIGNNGSAHSGSHYLFSLYRKDGGVSDEWAISPEIDTKSQTITFWAKSYSSSYMEKIAVYVSDGSTNPADFTLVEGSTVNAVAGQWTEYTVTLPEGSRRFAIRSFAANAFMLMIDDVTYIPAPRGESLGLEGYNVYRDGVKLNGELVKDRTYVDSDVEEGKTYEYAVTAVYPDGESAPVSVRITVDFSGIESVSDASVSVSLNGNELTVDNCGGCNVTVMTVDGNVLRSVSGVETLKMNVPSGVIIVNAGQKRVKLLVP